MTKRHFSLIVLLMMILGSFLFAQDNNLVRPGTADSEKNTPFSSPTPTEAVIFMEDFNGDNTVAGLQARGWVVLNEDGGGTSPAWFQPDGLVIPAYEGPDTGFVASNFQGANGFLINQWLISPQVTVNSGDTLSFWHRSPDGNAWDDSIYVRYSTTAGITPAAFDVTWGRYVTGEAGWQKWSGTFSNSGTIRFAIQYYIVDGGPSGTYSNYMGIDYLTVTSAGPAIMTIAQAREDLNFDGIPDRLNDTVTVAGTVISPNYQTTNHSYYIWDGTAGITEIMFGTTVPVLALGDNVQITGAIGHFRGLTQITPLDSASLVVQSSGNPVPAPVVLTLGQYKANPEMYEGTLVGFLSLSKASGTWPATGSATLKMTDGIDTVDLRIDSDTDIDGNPEPVWPRDILGIGSQFSSGATSYFDGYQILPRYFALDFLPAGTIPVELTSFTASTGNGIVSLNWSTATETNNSGFEVQRRTDNVTSWQKVGFVAGSGTTTENREYSFTDNSVSTGTFYYRLKQVDYNGSFEYSSEVMVDVSGVVYYELTQNYPNPFNPSTAIKFTIAEAGNVKLSVYNMLGQEVKTLINSFTEAGSHSVNFDASAFTSGVYLYKIESSNFVAVKKMTLIK